MQFHHAHAFRQTVVEALGREAPEALDRWLAAGVEPIEFEDFGGTVQRIGLRSRRETFERALRAAAIATPGFTLRRGHVQAVLEEGGRAAGVLVDGVALAADLVVDASGRAGRATRDLGERAGIGGPCGQAYVDRVYRLRPGAEPGPMTNPIAWQAELDGYLSRVFRHEAGLFSVLVVRRSDDVELRALRDPDAFEAATRAIPGLDVWTDPARSTPVTDVLAGGALLNVYRGQCDLDGELVLPGLFFVGDSVATTTPVFGRGITTTLWQCEALLSLLDHDAADLSGVGHAFDAWSADTMKPWVEDHIHMDACHVDRWNGADVDLGSPLPSDLILSAAEVRPEIMQHAGGYLSMAALPASLRAAEPIAREVYGGGWRPAYAPGPTRDELVDIVGRATAEPRSA
jgi:2-polyprenyl-6-methoxyphenol hydroxylase-like FAD-dependent oxidoreductase